MVTAVGHTEELHDIAFASLTDSGIGDLIRRRRLPVRPPMWQQEGEVAPWLRAKGQRMLRSKAIHDEVAPTGS